MDHSNIGLEQPNAQDVGGPPNDRPLILALIAVLLLAWEAGGKVAMRHAAIPVSIGRPFIVLASSWHTRLIAASVLLAGAALAAAISPRTRGIAALSTLLAIVAVVASPGYWYSPLQVLRWQRLAYAGVERRLVWRAWELTALVALGMSWLTIYVWRRRTRPPSSRAHGSAHWGAPDSLAHERGLIVGLNRRSLLRLPGEGHLLTVAPTRSGKGVSCVIPNLLDHPGSVLVTDPKGENFAVTSAWRKAQGHKVLALDPFGVAGRIGDFAAAYNPVDLVDIKSPDAIDDARMLADMLVLPEGKEGEQAFWNEEARALLTGLIMFAAAKEKPADRSLTHVRAMLTQAPESFNATLTDMSKSEEAKGLIARAAARLLQKADRERSGVISTAQSHTHFLDSPRMGTVLHRSTFDFSELKTARTSVYLILPPDRIDGYARWLRLMIACGLLAITRTRGQPAERILFLLDEFAHLRRMHPVQRDIGLAGGYGVRFWLVLQDLSQLRSTYGDIWPTFLANVDVVQAFGTSDWETAEYLSKMTGDATVTVATQKRSTSVSHGRGTNRQRGTGSTIAQTGRRLLFPDEIRRLPRDQQLVFVKGTAPLLTERVNYLVDKRLATRAAANPLYAAVAS